MIAHLYCNCGHNEERGKKENTYWLKFISKVRVLWVQQSKTDVIRENNSQMTVHVADVFLVWSLLK